MTGILFCHECTNENIREFVALKYAVLNFLVDKFLAPKKNALWIIPAPLPDLQQSENDFSYLYLLMNIK